MGLERIAAGDGLSASADVVADNVNALRGLFPEAFTEDGIDFEVLKQLLGGEVADSDEKYGLNWHGKRDARRIALTPSTGTLRPCPEESVDWDTTRNLMIEGDNLEVLKLLQKSYSGKVKLIYIDPPYNTGKDFVYKDDYQDNIRNYLELTGQVDGEGRKLSTNVEASGRFHTDWLNMMYPRLKLARNLLRDDGVIFISIDDNELENLITLCNEVFGEENHVGTITVIVNPRGRHLDRHLAKTHDYLVGFARSIETPGVLEGLPKSGRMVAEYDHIDERGRFRKLGLRNRNQAFNPSTRPNLYYPLYVESESGRVATSPEGVGWVEVWPDTKDGVKTCWTWGREKVSAQSTELVADEMQSGIWRIYRKDYLFGPDGRPSTTLPNTVWSEGGFNNDVGRARIKDLFGSAIMSFPKPVPLMERIVAIGAAQGGTVVDFFAGSGSSAEGVFSGSARDGKERRFIQIQLPERVDDGASEGVKAIKVLADAGLSPLMTELTKERLRRAGVKVKEEHPEWDGDVGFRVFKLDSSNIRAWNPDTDDVETTLLSSLDHVVEGRSDGDVLFEVLLKLGLDLCVPIEQRETGGVVVSSVGGGVLMTCLAESLSTDQIEAVGTGIVEWIGELAPAGDVTVVFRDSAFENDVAKTNMAAILEQGGVTTVRSI